MPEILIHRRPTGSTLQTPLLRSQQAGQDSRKQVWGQQSGHQEGIGSVFLQDQEMDK